MTNVFKFPEHKIIREIPPQIEELEKAKEKGRQNYADDIIDDLIEGIMNTLDNYGVDNEGKNFEKDFSFAIEALRGAIYRSLTINHHLHDFIDSNVTVIKKGETGDMTFDIDDASEDIIINDVTESDSEVDTEK
jgi:hypothetical protein